MSWSDAYIAIPFARLGRSREGLDCWGLPCLVYAEQLGITLPSYTGSYTCDSERAELARLLDNGAMHGPWQRVDTPQPFDLAGFTMAGHVSHVAICLGRDTALHAHVDQVKILRLDAAPWTHRLAGYWRHAGMLR
ncbi:C40 family peptidase [Sagittula sp. NFXS13]|uniref:C40 family peptidase n=1 Tax=Sagittula sp. NFXS13 TaxID=2819095 RepID=UPI0032DE6A89